MSNQMRYDANKKSALPAYLIWFFAGAFGGHRFYCGQKHAFTMLIGMIVSIILAGRGIASVGILVFCIWAFIDVFYIHK
ncbi:MAG: TM2 domain-containing protein [Deltaproteobacteria bacterium]|nr:TM2 domain-containing protein [Deltaproteobacteria bacterium]